MIKIEYILYIPGGMSRIPISYPKNGVSRAAGVLVSSHRLDLLDFFVDLQPRVDFLEDFIRE